VKGHRQEATRGSSQQVGATRGWVPPPCCVGGLWPSSGSRSVFGTLQGKIRLLELVSSNSENIFCVAFLKHKNSRKQGLALWHLVNRLVPEIA
jgi:hypothetical protein